MNSVQKIAADILKKKAGSDIRFNNTQIVSAIQKMMKVTPEDLKKIFESSGYGGMKFESVAFKDFYFGTVYEGRELGALTAMYECVFFDDNEGEDMRTNCFVMWDGKKFRAEVSGVSHKV